MTAMLMTWRRHGFLEAVAPDRRKARVIPPAPCYAYLQETQTVIYAVR